MAKVLSVENREYPFRKRAVPKAKVFVPEMMLSLMTEHADAGLLNEKEIMGLMIGRFYRDDNGEYAEVDRIATSDLIADEYSVRFDRDSMDKLSDSLDLAEGESIVGWYHSHLDLGCFMSETDIATQDGIFGGECGFALVIDPVRKEMRMFDSTLGNPGNADMIVIDND